MDKLVENEYFEFKEKPIKDWSLSYASCFKFGASIFLCNEDVNNVYYFVLIDTL